MHHQVGVLDCTQFHLLSFMGWGSFNQVCPPSSLVRLPNRRSSVLRVRQAVVPEFVLNELERRRAWCAHTKRRSRKQPLFTYSRMATTVNCYSNWGNEYTKRLRHLLTKKFSLCKILNYSAISLLFRPVNNTHQPSLCRFSTNFYTRGMPTLAAVSLVCSFFCYYRRLPKPLWHTLDVDFVYHVWLKRCDWSVVSPFSSHTGTESYAAFLSHPPTYYCAATVPKKRQATTNESRTSSHHPPHRPMRQKKEEKQKREKMMPLVVPTTAHYQSFLHSAYNSSIVVSPFS